MNDGIHEGVTQLDIALELAETTRNEAIQEMR